MVQTTKKEDEFITHEASDHEAWVCICGNMPHELGFYPIDSHDQLVDPSSEESDTTNFVCARCGRVIDFETLRVVNVVAIEDLRIP